MQLKIRFLKWSAGLPVVMINKKTASRIGIHTNDRISLKTLSKKPISSLQIQQKSGKYHTLSCKKKQFNTYGQRDIIISADVGKVMVETESGLKFGGEICWVRRAKSGEVKKIIICRGDYLSIKKVEIKLKKQTDFIEIDFDKKSFSVISGKPEDIQKIIINPNPDRVGTKKGF